MQQGTDVSCEVIPGGAADHPAFVQCFARRKNLLDHDPRFGCQSFRALSSSRFHRFVQLATVSKRLCKAVYMVDAQAVNQAFGIKTQRKLMYCVEDFVLFNPDADQLADLKEPAPVNCSRSLTPPCQLIVLPRQ